VEIAKELVVYKSTISRELKRNSRKFIKNIQLKKLIMYLQKETSFENNTLEYIK